MSEFKTKGANFLAKISDNTKAAIFRWWLAGCVYFFIGWGTELGLSTVDFIFVLGLVTGLVHIFLFNPIVYGMFEVERDGKLVNKKYYERTILEGAYVKIAEIMKSLISVVFVFLTYFLVNVIYCSVMGYDSYDVVFISGEPILYATLFVFYYIILTKIYIIFARLVGKVVTKFKKTKIEDTEV